jgi:hypothetical protein
MPWLAARQTTDSGPSIPATKSEKPTVRHAATRSSLVTGHSSLFPWNTAGWRECNALDSEVKWQSNATGGSHDESAVGFVVGSSSGKRIDPRRGRTLVVATTVKFIWPVMGEEPATRQNAGRRLYLESSRPPKSEEIRNFGGRRRSWVPRGRSCYPFAAQRFSPNIS